MNWVSILALVFTGVGLIISVIALIQSKKANEELKKTNNAAMRLKLEQELAGIERELADIVVQIEREKSAGHEQMSHIYGMVHPQANPHIAEINALIEKRDVLLKRKQQLKQLKGEIGPA